MVGFENLLRVRDRLNLMTNGGLVLEKLQSV
jgi:hypothetical protein